MVNNKNELVVFGFDAGDGEFSVYSIVPDAPGPNPVTVFNPPNQLSGYIKYNNTEIAYGNTLYEIDFTNFMYVDTLDINFKSTPGTSNDSKIKEFASIIYNAVKKLVPQYFSANHTQKWFIGCPSGWKNNELKDKYADIFSSAGIPNVKIVYESNAALSYYDRELSVVSIKSVEKGVMLLDYGSSTLDATFIKPNEGTTPYGCALGASYIEKSILNIILNKYSEYDCGNKYNNKDIINKVKIKYEQDEKFKNWLQLQTRKLKEQYFRSRMHSIGFTAKSPSFLNVQLPIEIDWGVVPACMALFVDSKMMDQIINSPIKNIVPGFDKMSEFTINDICNESWSSRNNKFLKYVSEQHPDYVKSKSLLVLTGGASQMDFVRDSVEKYFPNSILNYDTDPSTTIAKGLTYWGPAAIKAEKFDQAFDEIMELQHRDENGNIELDSDGDSTPEILNIIFEGYKLMVDETLLGIATQERDSLRYAIDKWFNADIQCSEITSTAAKHFENWMETEMPAIYNKGIENCTEYVKEEVNKLFKDLYTKNGLFIELFSAKSMELSLTGIIKEFFDNNGKDSIMKEIKSCESAFSGWGNGFKIKRRLQIDRDNAFKAAHDIAQTTYDWLNEVFYSSDFLKAIIYDNYATIKAELENKKENVLYNLGLVI